MKLILPLLLITVCFNPVVAQSLPRAILADGAGPWRDDRWASTVTEFSRLLSDAGYSVTTVSPVDLPSALGAPEILLAVPSLESLPFDTFKAVVAHLTAGGSLMASGGEPFRDALYPMPDGKWLDFAAYAQAVGPPPPEGPFYTQTIETLSPSQKQYTNSVGLRIPVARGRGLTATPDEQGRYRVIGDLVSPSATLYVNSNRFSNLLGAGSLVVWLPWPQLFEPQRTQLVAALHAARNRLHLLNAGPEQIVWLPGEHVTGGASILNAAQSPVEAVLQWSIAGASGVISQPAAALSLAGGELRNVPLDMGRLPNGDYAVTFRLMIGAEEVDRLESPVRVFDPTLARQADQKIRVVNGSFSAGGRHVFLHGVNYWPRYIAGLEQVRYDGRSWLGADLYDPDLVEADLSEIAALGFNLLNIQYGAVSSSLIQEGRALMDFLERCRQHGIWVRVALRTTLGNAAYTGMLLPSVGSLLEAAYLPGNDRVFAYELLWEPMVGSHDQGGQGGFVNGVFTYNLGRLLLDPDWRSWINDQYGSVATAENSWGLSAPRDEKGQVTNPLDSQMTSDGPWRIMVAAYRRFLEDYLGRNLGLIAREIRGTDPDTPLTYRNWATMTSNHNFNTGYDIGTAAAHLDFFSPERYTPLLSWPEDRVFGLVVAYSRYRTGSKPVQWAEFGYDVGPNGGTPASRGTQAAICDTIMRQVADDGSNAESVWWWPGGYQPDDGSDYGIIDPDGTPRDCALVLAKWGATFAAAAPDLNSDPGVTLAVDRDADARGSYGLFLSSQKGYVQTRQAGKTVVLVDKGTGTDTSTMPLIQVGNAPYAGAGPLKFANAEFGGVHVVCPTLDVTVENGATIQIPSGAACQVAPTLVNTSEARWLPTSAPKAGVILHTNLGDVPLTAPVPGLQRIGMGSLAITMGQNPIRLTGRLRIQGVGDFGEVLNLTLALDSTLTGSCAISLSSTTSIASPSAGATGTIKIATAAGCAWTASSPQPWVAVTPASGGGSGAVNYTIQPNTGPERQTTIMVADHPFTVTEAARSNPALVQVPALSATSLNFGSRTVGAASPTQTVKLTNTGPAALNLAMVAFGGANSADFAQTNTCDFAIAVGASCTINITFTPSGAGTRTASLFVTGNISGGPLGVGLAGIGTDTGPTPVILAIVDSWGYTPGVAPGLWVTIAGTNMAGPPQTWNLKGVQQLPITLGGVTVTFNGTPAALFYVSATQINALVPASVGPGPVQVAVQVNGVSSSPFTITAKATQPAVYAPTADASSFFVTAALQGSALLVGNSAMDPRVLRVVYPGDILDLYMIGLGTTADPSKFITDKVFYGAFPVSATVTATVGGETAPVLFAGLTSPGLYLVRISIPSDLAARPQPVQVSTGGEHTSSPLVLMMGAAPPNLIENGSFESPLTGTWDFSVDASLGAAATIQRTTSADVDGGSSAQVIVKSAATNTANVTAVQLRQAGFPLQQGEVYRLKFWAKADTARTIRFDVLHNGGGFQTYGLNGAVPLGGDWQMYVIYFQATATDPLAQLDFYFGDQAGSTWLDAVVLQGTSP